MSKKNATILGLISCIGFIFAGLYVYFFKGASLQLLILDILFFGTGAIVELITLTSKHRGWFAKRQDLSKKQTITMSGCCLIFGFCSLGIALFSDIHILLRIVLFFGFLFFTIGSVVSFKRINNHRHRQGLEEIP